MAKTFETNNSVNEFLNTIEEEQKKKDSFQITEIFKKESGFKPKMWGPSIIGFGSYHYVYESGHEGDAPLAAFSPRKGNFALYLGLGDDREILLSKFGKHKTAKSCIYINKLEDIDVKILQKMVKLSVKIMKNKYK